MFSKKTAERLLAKFLCFTLVNDPVQSSTRGQASSQLATTLWITYPNPAYRNQTRHGTVISADRRLDRVERSSCETERPDGRGTQLLHRESPSEFRRMPIHIASRQRPLELALGPRLPRNIRTQIAGTRDAVFFAEYRCIKPSATRRENCWTLRSQKKSLNY
jgi:hypothetical protein